MLKKSNISYQSLAKYAFLFFCFLIFSCLEREILPYSSAVLVCALALNFNPFLSPVLYILSFICLGKVGLIGQAGIFALVFFFLGLFYIKSKKKPIFIYSAFTAVAMLGFVLLGDTKGEILMEKRLIVAILSTFLSLVLTITGRALKYKSIKIKFGFEEYACLALSVSVFGLGVCNLISPFVWKGLSAFIILCCCFLLPASANAVICPLLGVGFALQAGNVNHVSTMLVWGLTAFAFIPVSRYVSALSLILTDCVCQALFSVYPFYDVNCMLPIIIAGAIFCIIPTPVLEKFKDYTLSFREQFLARQSINRNRLMLSNRLFELSSVFTEIKVAFNAFRLNDLSPQDAKSVMVKQILESLCDKCPSKATCPLNKKQRADSIDRMIDIGYAKGKLSLIDLPKTLADECLKGSELLYYSNKLLADYRGYCIDKANVITGRELLADEAEGVAEILRGLALDTGATLKFQRKTETLLSENLLKSGFLVSEVLIYGDSDRLSVSLILTMREYALESLQRVISKTVNTPMTLCDKINITEDKTYMLFKKSCPFDAVFGIARVTKEGSVKSGDTHSVIKIYDDRFLVALSDGMGSGERAERVSSASLSLIESFYKAGLKSELILSTVNKLLAINSDESFTALDVCIIDLKTCCADFIKYGSPYGFIIGENGVKIVEGNSLPLGILEELKPSVCSTSLAEENMVLLLTDGISDAFGQADEIIDYLRSVPCLNPQTLADGILKKALELSGGKPADDMTALAVRVYKKA